MYKLFFYGIDGTVFYKLNILRGLGQYLLPKLIVLACYIEKIWPPPYIVGRKLKLNQ